MDNKKQVKISLCYSQFYIVLGHIIKSGFHFDKTLLVGGNIDIQWDLTFHKILFPFVCNNNLRQNTMTIWLKTYTIKLVWFAQ
jgi:hypothetical protein